MERVLKIAAQEVDCWLRLDDYKMCGECLRRERMKQDVVSIKMTALVK